MSLDVTHLNVEMITKHLNPNLVLNRFELELEYDL